jgi:hypothetical protein
MAAASSPAAPNAALQAMAAEQQTGGSKRVPAVRSGAAGSPAVTVGAVPIALDYMHSGRAKQPEPNGIPVTELSELKDLLNKAGLGTPHSPDARASSSKACFLHRPRVAAFRC